MISDSEAIRRLHHEKAHWKKELLTDYVTGIIRGLTIAIETIQKTRLDHDASVTREWRFRRKSDHKSEGVL